MFSQPCYDSGRAQIYSKTLTRELSTFANVREEIRWFWRERSLLTMQFIWRFYWILKRKVCLAKMNNLPKHHGAGSQRRGAHCSCIGCIGLRPALCRSRGYRGASVPPKVLICPKFGQNLKKFGQRILDNINEIIVLCYWVYKQSRISRPPHPNWGGKLSQGARNSVPSPQTDFCGLDPETKLQLLKLKYETLEINKFCINPYSILSCNL